MVRKFITLAMMAMLLMIGTAQADGFGGVGVIDATVNVDGDSQALDTELTYAAGWYTGESFDFYGVWDQETNTVMFEEANVKFNLFDVNWAVGQKALPIGFMHMQRPQQSVFITAPRGDVVVKGLHMDTGYDIIQVEGMYWTTNDSTDNYIVKASANFMDDGLNVFVSYNDAEELTDAYGDWVVGGMFRFESLLANLAILGEYMPDNGDFWARAVTSPGVFNNIGLFAGYYNVNEVSSTRLESFEYNPDAWVYGAFVDLSDQVTASVEYKLDDGLNPIVLQFTATF